jgi:gliding motility-associated-like protein
MMKAIVIVIAFLWVNICIAQHPDSPAVTVDFSIPDTTCINVPVTAINLSQGATNYYWSFCTSDAGNLPLGKSLGTPFVPLAQASYIAVAEDSTGFYSFVTNHGDGSIVRNFHDHKLLGFPTGSTNLGTFGVLTGNEGGLQVKKENGHWYGFIGFEHTILRLDFGTSIKNAPTAVPLGPFPILNNAAGLVIIKDGANWTGFCGSSPANTIARISWGNSLTNTPVLTDLGNVGALSDPAQFVVQYDNGWYMLVCNHGNSTLSRLSFGNSLSNPPTGVNLGNVGSLENNSGIVLTGDCESLNAFVINRTATANTLIRLDLNGSMSGTITGQSLGNIGGLDVPVSFSDMFRYGDTLYVFVTNFGNSTMSILYFPGCTNSSIHSSTLQDPTPFSYPATGTYNVLLDVDEGLSTRQSACHKIVVMPAPQVTLGNDTTVCAGLALTLDAGAGFVKYTWSTGDTNRTDVVDKPGKYWVKAINRWGCDASDTIRIFQLPPDSGKVDTSVCWGRGYAVAGKVYTTSGTYVDTVKTPAGCDSILTTNLVVKTPFSVYIGKDTILCPGDTITVKADISVPGTTLEWQDGSMDSVYKIARAGVYWLHATKDKCMYGDTLVISDCPAELWFPNAFTPNGDGINDVFRPKGISIAKFSMIIYNRWGELIFQTKDISEGWKGEVNGKECPPGVYIYFVTYSGAQDPANEKKMEGSFNLIR